MLRPCKVKRVQLSFVCLVMFISTGINVEEMTTSRALRAAASVD